NRYMPAQLPLIPIIHINTSRRDELVSTTLQKIYYQPIGYHRNAKKLLEASLKAGYDFSLNEMYDWLERQAVHQIHKPRPRYIPRASFCSITTPNKVHQADVLYMPYDKVGRVTYLFCLNVVDVASRFKASVPIEVPFGLIDNDDYILKRPERSFVQEELMIIPYDTELPPQWGIWFGLALVHILQGLLLGIPALTTFINACFTSWYVGLVLGAKAKAKFICYYLLNTGEICGRRSTRPE
ncbi:21738_t:CDS:2, partial [Rhizophagus irregularis]